MRRKRGESISSVEGDSVPGGSVRKGSMSRSRSESWSRSRSRSQSVEIIKNPYARPNPLNPSHADANANARVTPPDESANSKPAWLVHHNVLEHEYGDIESTPRPCNIA